MTHRPPEPDALQLCVRIDDVFNRGHPSRPRTLVPVMDLIESHGLRLILNVIPRRLIESPNQHGRMTAELRAAVSRGHEIIQHGYGHCCRQCGHTSHQTYCSHLDRQQPRNQMLAEIQRGKEMLEAAIGQPVHVYGPTGSDPHTAELLSVVKQLGFLATTGDTTPDHDRLNLPALGGGTDYVFGATTADQHNEAFDRLIGELDQTLASPTTPRRFHILLHDPGIRPTYADGLTLTFLDRTLHAIRRRTAVHGVQYRDILDLRPDSGEFTDPSVPAAI